jgi:GDP-4-dehydro-6-deoxy-D-mannose reductase
VIHLAGLVAEAPLAEHLAINVLGTENLYNALTEMDCYKDLRVIQAGTAAIYGQIEPKELPISEKNPFRPITAYAISKMAQDYLADKFWRTKGLGAIRARIFNLLGPGQPKHLVPVTFIRQLKAMRDGDSLKVGNLATRRDFIDVRDLVLAFDRLLNHGRPGAAYNIASGKSIAIWDIVNELISMSRLSDISIKPEYVRMRKNDIPDIFADTTSIAEAVEWQPQISLSNSLEDMWNHE